MPKQPKNVGTVALPDGLADTISTLDVAVMFCHQCVEGVNVDVVGLMLRTPANRLELIATSDDSPRIVELLKLQVGEESEFDDDERTAVVNYELSRTDDRYPLFSARALEEGFTSMHVLPMRFQDRTLGILSLLASRDRWLGQHDQVLLQQMADIATLAIIKAEAAIEARQLSVQLDAALQSRVAIEQAKGIISHFTDGSIDEAFRQIRLYARNRNLGLTAVAASIADGSLSASALLSGNIGTGSAKLAAATTARDA